MTLCGLLPVLLLHHPVHLGQERFGLVVRQAGSVDHLDNTINDGLLGFGGVVVSRTLLGADVAIEPALRTALRAFVPLFVVGLARVLLVVVAALFFLIPGVIVACGYVVAEQVIMLERPDRAVNALPRSWSLTKGFKGKVFRVVLLLLVFLQLLPATAAGVLGAMMPTLETYVQVGSSLVQLVLFPLMPISFTLLYYDLRVRKEAFDLVFMCSQLGIDADDAGVIAA